MFKHMFFALSFYFLLFSTQICHAEPNVEDYDLTPQYENLSVYKLVQGINLDKSFAYSLYYLNIPTKNLGCLICCMHGDRDENGKYYVWDFNKKRYDYAKCISELIFRASRKGYLNNAGSFDFVFLATCYSGYASSQVTDLPGWNAKLLLANLNKYPNYFMEDPVLPNGSGNTSLTIGYMTPKLIQLSRPKGNIPVKQAQRRTVPYNRNMIILTETVEDAIYIDNGE